MVMRKLRIFILAALALLLIALAAWLLVRKPARFDGQRAYRDVLAQVAFGPRTPGSRAHQQTVEYILAELKKAGWAAEVQETAWHGHMIRNILAWRGAREAPPEVLLGAHYDSRIFADQDTGSARGRAVPGANDGASGVAVLLELARTLPRSAVPVWLVFFDAEDNGGIEDWDWIVGSRLFAAQMEVRPGAVVIVDMVGDADLNLYIETNSDPALAEEIWAQAASLGYDQFRFTGKYGLLDDHTPFLEAGFSAVDIIDFDYPYWHTTADTPDKVSPESLEAVGRTLLVWLGAK